jgi:CO/xanthine dehydrogenase FAD-binding subunit
MDFLQPSAWAEALAAKADRPDAVPIAGGTDAMVELNFGRIRPPALLDLSAVPELRQWESLAGSRAAGAGYDGATRMVRIGAGVTYTRWISELASQAPGLAQAARSVGSLQIRNRGTVGGNLGTASPAGDSHPPLLAAGAVIEAESAARGTRLVCAGDFYAGPKRSVLAPDELIRAIRLPVATGPQLFSKIGSRNAMVIALCSFAIALHPGQGKVGTGLGAAGPTPLSAPEAEQFLAAELDWQGSLDPGVARRFGELVAAAARPIDDVRSPAHYRRHALAVLAQRTLTWAWDDYTRRAASCA